MMQKQTRRNLSLHANAAAFAATGLLAAPTASPTRPADGEGTVSHKADTYSRWRGPPRAERVRLRFGRIDPAADSAIKDTGQQGDLLLEMART